MSLSLEKENERIRNLLEQQEWKNADLLAEYSWGSFKLLNIKEAYDKANMALQIEGGHSLANMVLGVIYFLEDSGYFDIGKSFLHYKASANAGSVASSAKVGLMYETGTGVEKDQELARNYYEIAANNGHIASCLGIARSYFKESRPIMGWKYLLRYSLPLMWARLTRQSDKYLFL